MTLNIVEDIYIYIYHWIYRIIRNGNIGEECSRKTWNYNYCYPSHKIHNIQLREACHSINPPFEHSIWRRSSSSSFLSPRKKLIRKIVSFLFFFVTRIIYNEGRSNITSKGLEFENKMISVRAVSKYPTQGLSNCKWKRFVTFMSAHRTD